MKRFRRITAIALTLVVIAMLGISASAAGSNTIINGDFGVGATFSWNLTTSEARADAVFYGAEDDHIDFQNHYISIEYTFIHKTTNGTDEDIVTSSSTRNYSITAVATADSNHKLKTAKYYYEARYIANEVVDCYLYHGPVTLTNP